MTRLQPWPEVSRRTLVEFKVFRVLEARRTSPRNGIESGFFIVDTWSWCNVVAFAGAYAPFLCKLAGRNFPSIPERSWHRSMAIFNRLSELVRRIRTAEARIQTLEDQGRDE